MPNKHEMYRNGRIRLAAVAAILLTVGATTGWHSLLGWPALVLAADLIVTAVLLAQLRGPVPRRPAWRGRAGERLTPLGH